MALGFSHTHSPARFRRLNSIISSPPLPYTQPQQACDAAPNDGLVIQEAFLGEKDRAALLAHIRDGTNITTVAETNDLRHKLMAGPGWLSNRLVFVLNRGCGDGDNSAETTDDDAEVLLPVAETLGDKAEHQDHLMDGALAEGNVGVLYLEGTGKFVLKDIATGTEHRVAIEPGKLISWPNAGFLHRVEGSSPDIWRRMLGPMVFDGASNALVGVGGGWQPSTPPSYATCEGYYCGDSLSSSIGNTESLDACVSICALTSRPIAARFTDPFTYGNGECRCYDISECTPLVRSAGWTTATIYDVNRGVIENEIILQGNIAYPSCPAASYQPCTTGYTCNGAMSHEESGVSTLADCISACSATTGFEAPFLTQYAVLRTDGLCRCFEASQCTLVGAAGTTTAAIQWPNPSNTCPPLVPPFFWCESGYV